MILLWFLAGGAVEVLNTFTRKWSVGTLGTHSAAYVFAGIIGGFLLRLGGTALILVLAFRYSVASGAAALVGYWISRWLMVWWVNRGLAPSELPSSRNSAYEGNSSGHRSL